MMHCIYHSNCFDGFAAAWVVRKYYAHFGNHVEFHEGIFGEAPPALEGETVVIVDFSYPREQLERFATHNNVLVLDHHKTAYEALEGLNYVEFDMDRSGAGMTWDHYFPDVPRPELINHIEDRDLWRFALHGTREIHAGLSSYPFDFEVWDGLMAIPAAELAIDGAAVLRKHDRDIETLLPVVTRMMKIAGIRVPIANLPPTMTSDAGHRLADSFPFAGCYWDTKAGRVFSLRSRPGGRDVSAIAKRYGGGGHEHAAGFTMPAGWEGEE